jgi:hypothetical protein
MKLLQALWRRFKRFFKTGTPGSADIYSDAYDNINNK